MKKTADKQRGRSRRTLDVTARGWRTLQRPLDNAYITQHNPWKLHRTICSTANSKSGTIQSHGTIKTEWTTGIHLDTHKTTEQSHQNNLEPHTASPTQTVESHSHASITTTEKKNKATILVSHLQNKKFPQTPQRKAPTQMQTEFQFDYTITLVTTEDTAWMLCQVNPT